MSTFIKSLGQGNKLAARKTLEPRFNTSIAVPVDTLFSIQLKELLVTTHKQLHCEIIVLALFTCPSAAFGKPPFQSSKKVLNFNSENKLGHNLVFESRKTGQDTLLSETFEGAQIRLEVESEWGLIGNLTIFGGNLRKCQIGYQNLKLKIEQFITRAATQEKVRQWFGEPGVWCGISQALQLAERQLQLFSKDRRPILVKGNKGSGKRLAALYCAAVNARERVPFVQLSLAKENFRISAQELNAAWDDARGGTLYIKDATALDMQAWTVLESYYESSCWDTQLIIASAQKSSTSEALDVWLAYHCHTLTLPSFDTRKTDLRFLCFQHLYSDRYSPSLELIEGICSVLTKGELCQSIDDLHRFIDLLKQEQRPDSLSQNQLRELFCISLSQCGHKQDNLDSRALEKQKDLVIPIGKLYASRFSEALNPTQEHPAILKALTYLADHYQNSFSLQELAENAFVSPSHLSFLLKNRFGKSFKGLLIEFRIEKAQEILREFPVRQITHVCIDVGFVDLSHFEKTFKKITGLTPRKYREQHKQRLSISTS